jgi:hypothetical protein
MASLYRRGQVWWSKAYQNGKMVRTSLGTTDKQEARRVLKERTKLTARAERPTCADATWDTAGADLLAYHRADGTRNPQEGAIRIGTLPRYFAGWKLTDIDATAILRYMTQRRRQGQAAATINVELATLQRALRLTQKYGKLDPVPKIRMLRPAAPIFDVVLSVLDPQPVFDWPDSTVMVKSLRLTRETK